MIEEELEHHAQVLALLLYTKHSLAQKQVEVVVVFPAIPSALN